MSDQPLRLQDLPPPPAGRSGFPWTTATSPLSDPHGIYPRITIVTPSYNQGQYLEETIRSVLLQGYANLEYIVIDGGSSDHSVEIIRRYAPFLSSWISERDTGQANAINKGFARSTGDIMGWLNSDDLLLPGALSRIATAFIENPQTQIVTGFRKIVDQQSGFVRNVIWDMPTNYYLSHYCCVAQEATYWRRSLWEKLGALDETLQFAMDYDYWLRALDHGCSFQLIPYYVGGFRDYAQNKTNSWRDVHDRDMNVLYQRYAIGRDQADVHAQLGALWTQRYGLYQRIGKQAWTNSPRLVQIAWRLLEVPVICDAVLTGLWLNRKIQKLRRIRTFREVRALEKSLIESLLDFRLPSPASSDTWGDLRALLPMRQSEANQHLPEDTLSLGDGWYPLEYYRHGYFRWSSGLSEICIVNPSPRARQLKIRAAVAAEAPENRLEVLDENGVTLVTIDAGTRKIEFTFDLPPAKNSLIRVVLRWHGEFAPLNEGDQRALAFRLLRIGLLDSTV